MKNLFIILAFFLASATAHASVDSSDVNGTAHLNVKGGKLRVEVNFTGEYSPNFRTKLYYNTAQAPRLVTTSDNRTTCYGEPAAVANGPHVNIAKEFAYTGAGGTLIYATICVFNVVDGKEYLVRTLTDYDEVQGWD